LTHEETALGTRAVGDGRSSSPRSPSAATQGGSAAPTTRRWGVSAALGIGIPLALGLLHVALVTPRYHTGSFDDDASYILTAKALLSGQGLTGHLASGEVMVGLYPPGYGALLAPLAWLWPHSFAPMRAVSVVCFAAVFPLLWVYLGRHRVGSGVRTVALTVLALGPPFATFGTMVMAETPFLVLLLLLLLVLDRWQEDPSVLSPAGWAAVLLAVSLVWFKQAAVGLVLGLVLWLAFSRQATRRRRALFVAVVTIGSLVPVVVARLVAGVPLAGARYSAELGGFYSGGLERRLVQVVPHSTWHLLATAVPATIVPYLGPLPIHGHWVDLWKVVSWQVTILMVIGAVAWFRRYRDAAVPMTVVYLAESVLWPFVNERRAILVLPLLVSWYVVGGAWIWTALRSRLHAPASRRLLATSGVVLAAVFVAAPLVAQMPRDYLFGWDRSSSHFGGSRYASVLRQLGRPQDVVETDYRSSTALFTGHATNWNAFLHFEGALCYEPAVLEVLRADQAGYLLLGDVNKPKVIDNPCLDSLVSPVGNAAWAVPILHTARDSASVYELVGPYSGHPDLVNLLAGVDMIRSAGTGSTTLTGHLPAPAQVSQISLGEAAAAPGPTTGVQIEVQRGSGGWEVVSAARSAVGDGPAKAPYLLVSFPSPIDVTGIRVVVDGATPGEATLSDLAVLGPAPSGRSTTS
jgi:hypothetical protein